MKTNGPSGRGLGFGRILMADRGAEMGAGFQQKNVTNHRATVISVHLRSREARKLGILKDLRNE